MENEKEKEILEEMPTEEFNQEEVEEQNEPPKEPKNKKIMVLVSIIAIISIVIIIEIIILYLGKANSDKERISKTPNDIIQRMSNREREVLGLNKDEKISEEEKQKEEIDKKAEEENTTDIYKKYDELTDEEKEEIDIIPRKDIVPIEDLDDDDETKEIPAKFDLRDKINIKVEDQESYGLCWAFASFNALETHLALKQNKNYDFSEIHLDYLESNLMYNYYRGVHEGGNWYYFTKYMNIAEPINEELTTYNDQPREIYSKYTDFDSNIMITKDIEFPGIYKSGYNQTSEEDKELIRNSIKKHIMTNGGVYAVIKASADKNIYCQGDCFPNHAITLIGWDDNYSKDNFTNMNPEGKKKPEHDGAYIMLNSWGTSYGDNGYFYISYEDELVETEVYGILSTDIEDAIKLSDINSDKIRNYVLDNYKNKLIKYNNEYYITEQVLNSETYLNLSNMELTDSDLPDLSIFSKIYILDISNNKIEDLSNLPHLNRLDNLDISNNNIKSLDNLKNYSNIFSIRANNNQIENVTIPERVEYLILQNNNITNINITNNNELVMLDLSNNQIEEITNVSGLNHLYDINLSNNKIKDVSILSELPKLQYVTLDSNPNVTGYEKLNNIVVLSLNNCNISKLNNISNLSSLKNIKLSDNKDIEISANDLPKNIEYFELKNDNLSNLNFLNQTNKIVNLGIENNNITNLNDLPSQGEVITINISNNPITDISRLKNYEYVVMTYINSTAVDISIFDDINSIKMLFIKNSNITDISNLKLKSLEYIDLSQNPNITGLSSLSKNNNLDTIILEDCNISDLSDITKITSLVNINLDKNNINNIEGLNKLTGLRALSLKENKNITGKLKTSISSINLENTNSNYLDIIKDLKELSYLGITGNNITNFEELNNYLKSKNDFFMLSYDTIKIDLNSIGLLDYNKNTYLYGKNEIEINLNNQSFIDFMNNNYYLRSTIMKIIQNDSYKEENGTINKKVNKIEIEDPNKPYIMTSSDYTITIYK